MKGNYLLLQYFLIFNSQLFCCKVKDLFGKMICNLDYFAEYCSNFRINYEF
mgnify:CR=1 FL=1